MSDENILSLSDENKSTIRNYAMVAGFFTIFLMFIIEAVMPINNQHMTAALPAIGSTVLLLMGIIIALLHKRDQIAISFMFISLFLIVEIVKAMMSSPVSEPIIGLTGDSLADLQSLFPLTPVTLMLILFGIMMLITRNEQRYITAGIILPYAIADAVGKCLLQTSVDLGVYVISAGLVISALVALYAAVVLSLENPKIPGYGMLTADEECESNDGSPVHFKVSGAVLGYSLFALPAISYILYYLGISNVPLDSLAVQNAICGALLILTGLIMLVAGRMRFTPFLFVMLGMVLALSGYLEGLAWLNFVFLFIIGLILLFRSERRILVGVAIIIFSVSWLLSDAVAAVSIPALSAILNIVPFVILMYVCFALCSDGRLKLC